MYVDFWINPCVYHENLIKLKLKLHVAWANFVNHMKNINKCVLNQSISFLTIFSFKLPHQSLSFGLSVQIIRTDEGHLSEHIFPITKLSWQKPSSWVFEYLNKISVTVGTIPIWWNMSPSMNHCLFCKHYHHRHKETIIIFRFAFQKLVSTLFTQPWWVLKFVCLLVQIVNILVALCITIVGWK